MKKKGILVLFCLTVVLLAMALNGCWYQGEETNVTSANETAKEGKADEKKSDEGPITISVMGIDWGVGPSQIVIWKSTREICLM